MRRFPLVLLTLAVSISLPSAGADEPLPPEDDFYGRGEGTCVNCGPIEFRIVITDVEGEYYAVPAYSGGVVTFGWTGPFFWLSGSWQDGWVGHTSVPGYTGIARIWIAPYGDGSDIDFLICHGSLLNHCWDLFFGTMDHVSLEEFIAP